MAIPGLHLTPIGNGDFLLEPSRSLDIGRADELVEKIVSRLQDARPSRLYYDLAEMVIVDPIYYNWLNLLARACRAFNVNMICIHMQPTAAFALAHHMREAPAFETALDVAGWKTQKR